MKDTGIVRNIDQLGRVTIPREILKVRGIELKSPVEIYVEGPKIIIEKYVPEDKQNIELIRKAYQALCSGIDGQYTCIVPGSTEKARLLLKQALEQMEENKP